MKSFAALLAASLLIIWPAHAQQPGAFQMVVDEGARNRAIEDDALQMLRDLSARYEKMTSYSDEILGNIDTPSDKPNTFRVSDYTAMLTWKKGAGARMEGHRDRDDFVVRSDERQLHVRWRKSEGKNTISELKQGDAERNNRPLAKVTCVSWQWPREGGGAVQSASFCFCRRYSRCESV